MSNQDNKQLLSLADSFSGAVKVNTFIQSARKQKEIATKEASARNKLVAATIEEARGEDAEKDLYVLVMDPDCSLYTAVLKAGSTPVNGNIKIDWIYDDYRDTVKLHSIVSILDEEQKDAYLMLEVIRFRHIDDIFDEIEPLTNGKDDILNADIIFNDYSEQVEELKEMFGEKYGAETK